MPPVENFVKAIQFARGEAGDPYVWGGDGPHGWDCSGFMGGIRNVLYGEPAADHRTFGTGTISSVYASIGFKAGKGSSTDFTIGVLYPWESQSGIGHTAGTIDGLKVEARGGRGVLVGAEARGADDPLFRHHFHIPLEGDDMSAEDVKAINEKSTALADQVTRRVLWALTHGGELAGRPWVSGDAGYGDTAARMAESDLPHLMVEAERGHQAAVTAADAARQMADLLAATEGRIVAAIEAIPAGPGGGITYEQAVAAAKDALRQGTES